LAREPEDPHADGRTRVASTRIDTRGDTEDRLPERLEVDGTTLTFSFPDHNTFCPDGTHVWEYDMSGETLTSDLVGGLCPGGVPWEEGPPSPDWVVERQ
jgi:hypothetical protein